MQELINKTIIVQNTNKMVLDNLEIMELFFIDENENKIGYSLSPFLIKKSLQEYLEKHSLKDLSISSLKWSDTSQDIK